MVKRLSPHFIQLVQNAAHKSFWRKGALKNFLRRNEVPGALLGALIEAESKHQWLDFVFPRLEASESGQGLIFRMARSLAEQKTFPDLQNMEDSQQKIAAAHEAVSAVRDLLGNYDRNKDAEKEAAIARQRGEEQRLKTVQARQTLEGFREKFELLTPQLGTEQGGYGFERWFYGFMDFSDVMNRRPYRRPDDRQIDGSVTIESTNYLVELKFCGAAAGVDVIDSHMKKVTDVADNTMGVILSVSGFTDGAKRAASIPKTPLLLLDHSHLYLALTGAMRFGEIVKRIGRHASQEGAAYLAVTEFGG